jgi:predicted  nucleic acid-binding Zn-ribbon protein
MLADLQHLIQLQEIDSTAERLRRRIEDIPRAQEALQARLDAATAAVDAVKTRIAANQVVKRDIDKDLAAAQGRLSKYKDQLMAVKTNKEYQAMQHEIAAAETGVRALEDRELDRMEEAESLSAALKAAESALKSDQAEVARDQKALDVERGDLAKQLEALNARRGDAAGSLSKEALALFDKLSHTRKGLAVAEARDGLCTVCHVRLRPQVFNEVRRNDSLIQCDSCTRILYFVPVSAAPAS